MGFDKTFAELGGRPLVARAIDRLRPQCADVAINANGDNSLFRSFGAPVVADDLPDLPGPLAGILAGLDHAREHGFEALLSLPVDTPFAPLDLAARLSAARGKRPIGVAASAGRSHHAVALWSTALAPDMRRALQQGERGVGRFVACYDPAVVEWADAPIDPFFNINSPDDLVAAERAFSG